MIFDCDNLEWKNSYRITNSLIVSCEWLINKNIIAIGLEEGLVYFFS